MQETIKMIDVISWLSGFYDAEGCVRINKSVRKNGYTTYRPVITLNNTDIETMDYCVLLLKKHDISGHVRESLPTTPRQKIKYLEISRITKIIALCDLLLPFLITKYDEFLLLKQFCVSRRDRFLENGIKNSKLPYNDYEISLYEKLIKYKAHKKGRKCLSYTPIYSESPNNITWSWFAGYTDGDGSLSINKRGSSSYCIGTTNPATSDKLDKFFRDNYIDFYFYSNLPAKNHLSSCKLRMFKYFVNDPSNILKILRHIKYYTISKLRIVELMIEYCELRSVNKGKWRTEYEKGFVKRMQLMTLR